MIDLARDFARLTEKLKNSKEISIPLQSLESEEEIFANGLVTKALAYIGQIRLEGTLHLAVAELLSNAEKALLKRTFAEFFANTADYDNPDFLKSFHRKLREDLRSLRAILKKSKPSIEVNMKIQASGLSLSILTGSMPSLQEDEFIHRAMEAGLRAKSLADLEALPDTIEAEGRGLAISVFSLKSAGIPGIVYALQGDRACFSISVPAHRPDENFLSRIGSDLIGEIQSLPAFPDTTRKLLEMCNSPDTDLKSIALEIGRDAAIAGELIRVANSGGFAGGRVADIAEAAKILGMSNITGLLMRSAAYAILDERYGVTEELLAHPVRVAVYSRTLARKYKLSAIADQAYVAGLLHDIGKIVLIHHMKQTGSLSSVEKTSRFRDRRSQVNLEEIACGADHALIGKLLGEKWNFPDELCMAIGMHHSPLGAPKETRKLACVVYMANALADYEEGQTEFYSVEPEVLAFFNIATVQAFQMLAGSLNSEYSST
jgi:HD-like signal output (HDOD) protein